MAVVDADYSTYIEILRGHLVNGTQPSGSEIKYLISILKNAITKAGGPGSTYTTLKSDITSCAAKTVTVASDVVDVAAKTVTLAATIVAQLAILQAKGTADASVEIDTADTAITADKAALVTSKDTLVTDKDLLVTAKNLVNTDVTANDAALPTVPTYTTNTVMDG